MLLMEEDRACEMLHVQLSAARGRFRECLAEADRTQGKLPTYRYREKGLFPRRMARSRLFAEFRSSVIDFSTAMNAVAVKLADVLECR